MTTLAHHAILKTKGADSVSAKEGSKLSTQTDTIAARHNQANNSADPCAMGYWTAERLTWLEEAVKENEYLYEAHIEEGNHMLMYRPSTGELIRRLKGLPEWAGLSARQAHDALAIALGKIWDAEGDPNILEVRQPYEGPWDQLPDNHVKGVGAEEDFIEAWPKVRGSQVNLAEVVEQAKARPISWSRELVSQLSPVTPRFKLFCDVCMYLQSMVGADGYILIPQHQLAPLIDTKQGGISSYCSRAKNAGFLEELNEGRWSQALRQAKHWRCTSHLERNLAFSNSGDIPY